MSNPKFSDYTVDHLFLLVGENPLPNYVAAHLLLEPSGTVHLVYTQGTTAQFDTLSKVLKQSGFFKLNQNKIEPVKLGASDSDSFYIYEQLQKAVQPKGKPSLSGKVGLHYTGGTKAMAVHAYRAFLDLQLPEKPVFSYLNPRKLQLCFDDFDLKRSRSVSINLQLTPHLQEIIALHNLSWDERNPPILNSLLPDAATTLLELHQQSHLSENWKNWCKSFERLKTNRGWKPEKELAINLKLTGLQEELKRFLREHLQASTEEISLQHTTKILNFGQISSLCHWLNGGWLEDYVLAQVQTIADKYKVHNHGMSIHIEDPNERRNPDRGDQFELDVAFLRGYQLFAISCTTTSEHKYCKQKLFEVHLRARQLGGDEARVALVSFYEQDTKRLKNEMSFLSNDKRIEVFGLEDVCSSDKFKKKLEAWISRNT